MRVMKVWVTGSHGLIGTALIETLTSRGDEVGRIVRGGAGPDDTPWDTGAGVMDAGALEGADAVVHLAGASIARRWSAGYKVRLRDSRIQSGTLLATTLSRLERPPRVLVSGSAVGYYGDRGAEVLTEVSRPGTGFLAQLAQDWEAATAPAEEAGVRVVHLRTGIVQSARGGALRTQLPVFKLGLGAQLGSGRQYVSWISLPDEVGAILHAIADESIRGPINATAPNPVTNAEYTRVLGATLGRPTLLRVPAGVISLALGSEMAADTLLPSQRVRPARLEATGYRWRHPELADALGDALGRPGTSP
jgi:uncharacterized protein